MMWSVRHENHLYVFWNGQLILKRWVSASGKKTAPSMLFNEEWPNERIS